MSTRFRSLKIVSILAAISTLSFAPAQVTEIVKKTDILEDPDQQGEILGRLNPGTEIRKIGRDESGDYIRGTLEFYVPVDALKEWRIARRPGESQTADDAIIKLLSAQRSGEKVRVALEISNEGDLPLDMSALLLIKVIDGAGLPGNLEFMESKGSVATIPPGETVNSKLVYTFPEQPEDVELIFQSTLQGDKVYFDLGF